MKLNPVNQATQGVLGVIGTLKTLSFAALLYGTIYTVKCEKFVNTRQDLDSCFFQGGAIMGLGGMGRAGAGLYMAGYNTENPNITRALLARKREENSDDSR